MSEHHISNVTYPFREKTAYYLKVALLIAIIFHILVFWVPKAKTNPYATVASEDTTKAVEIKEEFFQEEAPPIQEESMEANLDVMEIEIGDEKIDEKTTISKTSVDPFKQVEEKSKEEKQEISKEFVAFDNPPKVIRQVAPVYPELARKAGLEGTVYLNVHIDVTGKVDAVEVVKSVQSGPGGLDEAAVNAVKKWVFKPADQNGTPVAVWYGISVKFEIPK